MGEALGDESFTEKTKRGRVLIARNRSPLRVLASVLRNMIWFKGEMLNVGDVAPDFAVPDHAGQTRRLSDYRGKTVVLWFYPKADTPG